MARTGNPNWKPGMPPPNPAGRKAGSKNKKTIIMEELSRDGSALAIAIKTKGLEGDAQCLALWLSRLEPPLRARAEKVTFDLDKSLPLHEQAEQIMAGIAESRIDPETGALLIACLDKVGNLKAVSELEARLAALENKP